MQDAIQQTMVSHLQFYRETLELIACRRHVPEGLEWLEKISILKEAVLVEDVLLYFKTAWVCNQAHSIAGQTRAASQSYGHIPYTIHPIIIGLQAFRLKLLPIVDAHKSINLQGLDQEFRSRAAEELFMCDVCLFDLKKAIVC